MQSRMGWGLGALLLPETLCSWQPAGQPAGQWARRAGSALARGPFFTWGDWPLLAALPLTPLSPRRPGSRCLPLSTFRSSSP